MNDESAKAMTAAINRLALALEKRSAPAQSSSAGTSSTSNGGELASDYEMTLPFGDPIVKKLPRGWTTPNFIAKKFSQTSPEFLEALVGFLEWKAEKEEEKEAADPKLKRWSKGTRTDIRRARTWAKRLREGWAPPAPTSAPRTTTSLAQGWGGASEEPEQQDFSQDDGNENYDDGGFS